jgi:hypothetical protein
MKTKNVILLSFLFVIVIVSSLFGQIRIDWQQTYGGQLPNCYDEAWGIAPTDGGYLVAGVGRSPNSVMVTCDFGQQTTGNWLLKIGYHGELLWQACYPAIYPLDLDRSITNKNVYYSIGEGRYPTTGKASLGIAKYNADGEMLWSRNLGNENYSFPYEKYGCATTDGGVIGGAQLTFSEGGDVGHYYGQSDGWIVKLDSLGQTEWEISIGTAGTESIHHLSNAADEGYYAFLSGYTIGDGSIGACDIHVGLYTNDNILVKLSHQGEVEWTRCYGGSNSENSYCLMELDDGLLLAGISDSEDGDLQGANYHLGYWHTGVRTTDVWLLRTDADGNILWSRCYGGSGFDTPWRVFQNEDGGFTVFGLTESKNGDVQSAQNLIYLTGDLGRKLWIFRTDADGNLLWERAIGHTMCSRIGIGDVLKESDREYVIAATSETMLGEHNGDYYCTNDTLFDGHTMNYWVLHVTDTVDYTTLQVPERPMPKEEATVEVYPNPTNNTVCVLLPNESEATEMELINMSGQVVATKTFSGMGGWMEMGDLPKGIYMLRIRNAEVCLTRKVLRD